MTTRQIQAQELYRSIVQQLKMCNEIFTRHYIKVYPKCILVYKNQNAPGLLGFVLIPYRFSYKKNDGDASIVILLNQDENKRLAPPEITFTEYYKNRFPEKMHNIFDVGASEIWSASACTLNFITDKNVDKWNNVNFEKSLSEIINNSIHQDFSKLKDELLINLKLDNNERRSLIEAIRNLP